ncbi:SagB/ThcOx family dehydrogenase (plasmid) [Caballeronia sp. NK8]|uniref:SagB/ThcOx family dehydrogenase n=1 Tax=Caballeronia sp. NK8 TaxID=140098 RepID=UPI001BB733DF|nr:SagB/ThcOx family dehydrogenase [Caballeronia sp. NK8]BCQ28962.1 SagB/ThcOx family dehydrogenase [Caballeronia sp. NK8]
MADSVLLSCDALPEVQPAAVCGAVVDVIELPKPDIEAGAPLLTALSRRKSHRSLSEEALCAQALGELLWAANGINRPESGGRTAPSAQAFNEIDIYAALPGGVYRYDPKGHRLVLKHAVDARNLTGYQDFVGTAPLDLVYVVQMSRLLQMPPQQRETFSAIAAGCISQNVSLYCASAGLATVVRGWINHRLLADALRLNEDELPILAQTIGKPAL